MSILRVIAYDIPDDRRRNRVAKLLEGHGERVQDSVFECWLDADQLRRLQRRLRKRINPTQDKLRFYSLCGKDQADIVRLGRSPITTDNEHRIV